VGLVLIVGLLAQQQEDLDEEEFRSIQTTFGNLNSVLNSNSLALHHEPHELSDADRFEADMIGYYGLHYVRRLASHIAIHDELPPPITAYGEESEDEATKKLDTILAENNYRSKRKGMFWGKRELFAHLMLHSDAQGFYVPQDFEDVAFDNFDPQLDGLGGMIGSAPRLLRECEILSSRLEMPTTLHHDLDELWEASETPARSGPLWQVYGIEAFGIARLMAGCLASIRTGAALSFS
jgi:hypothetical protein